MRRIRYHYRVARPRPSTEVRNGSWAVKLAVRICCPNCCGQRTLSRSQAVSTRMLIRALIVSDCPRQTARCAALNDRRMTTIANVAFGAPQGDLQGSLWSVHRLPQSHCSSGKKQECESGRKHVLKGLALIAVVDLWAHRCWCCSPIAVVARSKRNVFLFGIPDVDRFGRFGRLRSSGDLVAESVQFVWRCASE